MKGLRNNKEYASVMGGGLRLTLGEFAALYRRVYKVKAPTLAKRLKMSPDRLRDLERDRLWLLAGVSVDATAELEYKVLGLNWRKLRHDGCSEEVLREGLVFTVKNGIIDHTLGKMSRANAAWLLRRRRGLTVGELAAALDVTKQTILNREAGRKDPRPNIQCLVREEDVT